MRRLLWVGMLLGGAASLFSQAEPPFPWFLLTETKAEVRRQLGQPKDVAEFATDFESWQYQIGDTAEGEYSHQLVFRKSTGQLISFTRNFEPERSVDEWFPPGETSVHSYPDAEHPQYSLRLRRLPGGRVLMSMGTAHAGQVTGQIVMMRETEIPHFYPWLKL